MTDVQTISSLLRDLVRSDASVSDVGRRLFEWNVTQARATDPEMAEIMRACAIPRRFDENVIGLLRNKPLEEARNRQVLRALTAYSFVIPRQDGYAYHDSTRDMLLEDWRSGDRRKEFDEISSRLVNYFEQQHKQAQTSERDLARVAGVVRRANRLRYSQLASLVESRMLAPLLEALYHEIQRSPADGYNLFGRYCEAFEAVGRIEFCRLLVKAAHECFGDVEAEQAIIWKRWLLYWEARLARRLRKYEETERILVDLLPDAEADLKLKLWTLGELSGVLQEQFRLSEAREISEKYLELAVSTRKDQYNLPVAHARVADIDWLLNELERAERRLRDAIDCARDVGNRRMETYLHLNLSGVLQDAGRWPEAFDAALVALRLTRTDLRSNPEMHQATIKRFMALFSRRDRRLLDAAYAEAEGLATLMGDSLDLLDLRREYAAQLRRCGSLARSDEILDEIRREIESTPGNGSRSQNKDDSVDLPDENTESGQNESEGSTATAPAPRNVTGLHVDPKTYTDILLQMALLQESRGRRREAISTYDQIVKRSELGDATIWHAAASFSNRGWGYADLGRWQEAEADFSEAISRWDRMGHAKLAAYVELFRASALSRQGRLDEAHSVLDTQRSKLALSDIDYLAEYFRTRGATLASQGRWEEARRHLGEALRLARLNLDHEYAARIHAELARVALDRGLWTEAASCMAEGASFCTRQAAAETPRDMAAVQADLSNANGMRIFISAHERTDLEIAEAREYLRRAVRAEPANFWFQSNLAFVCVSLKAWEEAAEAIETVLDQGPEWIRSPLLYERAAVCRTKQAEAAIGESALESAELALDHASAWLNRVPGGSSVPATALARAFLAVGEGFMKIERLDKAERIYLAAAPHASGDWKLRSLLEMRCALLAAVQSRPNEATARLRATLSAIPDPTAERIADLLRECRTLVTSPALYTPWAELLRFLSDPVRGLPAPLRSTLQVARLKANYDSFPGGSRFGREWKHAEERKAGPNMAMVVTQVSLEADAALFPTLEKWEDTHPFFQEYLPGLRSRILAEMGVQIPPVRVRGNEVDLLGGKYLIMIHEIPRVMGTVEPARKFCADPERVRAILGEKASNRFTYNPLTGKTDGAWLETAEAGNTPCWDYFEYMARHIEALVRQNLVEFMGVHEASAMVSKWAASDPKETRDRQALVERSLPDAQSRVNFSLVLKGLLRESVPIVQLGHILDVFSTAASKGQDAAALVETIRQSIRDDLPGNDSGRQLLRLSRAFERRLRSGIRDGRENGFFALPPEAAQQLLRAVRNELAGAEHSRITVVTRAGLRPYAARLLELEFAAVQVLSFDELPPGKAGQISRTISLED